jgi:hypothetical protein
MESAALRTAAADGSALDLIERTVASLEEIILGKQTQLRL